MFNTLRYAKRLEEVGISREQAETHIQIIADIVEVDVATKQDIKDLRDDMQKMEYRLIIKLGAVVAVVIGLALTILRMTLH